MSDLMNPSMQQFLQSKCEVQKVTYHTELQNFETKFDHLHKHHYPKLHQNSVYGARLNSIDLDTGKRRTLGHFELDM